MSIWLARRWLVSRHGMAARRSKAAYIRSLPRTLKAPQVVERAAREGVRVTAAYVNKVRSEARFVSVEGNDDRLRETLRRVIRQLGVREVRRVLDEFERDR